ncbi:MAG: VOC family protein [Alphaproteobacteria bacterium]|nr:VOC family protein [Alphaproteobacteria bacterium]
MENQISDRNFKFLQVVIRVSNLENSINFYQNILGFRILRQSEHRDARFTLVVLGYGQEGHCTTLELIYNWDVQEPYSLGTVFSHIAIGVNNLYSFCDNLVEHKIKITRPPGPTKQGGNNIIAFIEDPDGYRIELIENKP